MGGDLNATLKLGIHLFSTGEFTNAEPLLRQVHESGNSNGTRILGILELRTGRYQLAKELLHEALAKGTPNTNYWLYWALAKLGKAEESEEYLAAAYLEKDVQAVFTLGLRSSNNGDLDSSKNFFIEGMNLGHSNSARELIKLLKSMKHKKVEISLYKQAVEENNYLALSALEFLTLGKYGDAIHELKKDIPKFQ
jgi:tetratricopeptide (TPR) repeat protein